jgi:hypothetical protein
MKIMSIIGLVVMLGLSGCQKRDSDNNQQDQMTSPTSMEKDQ